MKQFLRVDEQGYYIEPVILEPIFTDEEGNKYYFPEDFIEHFAETEDGEPVEVTEEFIEENSLPELNCRTPKEYMIETPFPDGMYKPRWIGTEWIDEITQEELDAKQVEADAQPRMMSFEAMSMKLEHTEKVVNELIKQFVLADNLTEEQKELITSQYRKIGMGDTVYPDEIVNIDGKLFKMIQPIERTIYDENWLKEGSVFAPFLQSDLDGAPVIEEFKKPLSTLDAYQTGDMVLFNGDVYESIIDNNTWSPTEYPQAWKAVE